MGPAKRRVPHVRFLRGAPPGTARHLTRRGSQRMKYKIKSFVLGVKEARWMLCTTVYGGSARRADDMGRKISNGVKRLFKVRTAWQKLTKRRSRPRLRGDWQRTSRVFEIARAICL